MLVIFIDKVMRLLQEERYVESDTITEAQEVLLQQLKEVVIEQYGDGKRIYTLVGRNYK